MFRNQCSLPWKRYMFVFIVCDTIFCLTHSEDLLSSFESKLQLQTTQVWFVYIKKQLHISLNVCTKMSVKRMMTSLFYSCAKLRGNTTHDHLTIIPCFLWESELIAPVFNFNITLFKISSCNTYKRRCKKNFLFFIKLNSLLRENITF